MKITLPGSIRSKKNSKIATIVGGKNKPRRAIILPSKAYKEWEQKARLAAHGVVKEAIQNPVAIRVTAYVKGVVPDLSGVLESVGDCLEGVVIDDDKQIKSWDGSRVIHDKNNPRTEIEILPYKED